MLCDPRVLGGGVRLVCVVVGWLVTLPAELCLNPGELSSFALGGQNHKRS